MSGKRTRTVKLTSQRRRSLQGLVFLSPFIIGLLLFFMFPIIQSLIYSFSGMQYRGVIKDMSFVGLRNYQQAFMLDMEFKPKLAQTLADTLINTPLIVIFSLILAIIINKKIIMRSFFRAVFFLPFLLGTGFIMKLILGLGTSENDVDFFRGVVLTSDMQAMFGPAASLFINGVLKRIVLIFWQSGLQTLLFLAGLQGISASLFESAKVDGANEWVFFWKITIPMLSPVILINIVYTITASFNDIMNPVLSYIIDVSFKRLEYTYAASMAWVFFVIVLFIIGAVFLVMNRFVYKTDKA